MHYFAVFFGLAVETTGHRSELAVRLPARQQILAPVAVFLVLAVVLLPFVTNISTAIVLGSVAISIAHAAGMPPSEPIPIVVAMGASTRLPSSCRAFRFSSGQLPDGYPLRRRLEK
jgi:di/tricarboxylate transporter